MKTRTKALLLTLCAVLLVAATVFTTLAWLTSTTDTVTNTFTPANIDVTLTETYNTDTNNDGTKDKWQAQLIPGYSYKKDPKVTVSDDSVDCYLFVKFDETNNPSTYLTYTSTLTAANGWTQGDGTNIPANVWYRKVMASDTTRSWKLLSGDTITVKNTVTMANMLTAANATLTYTAYACQLYKANGTEFTAAEAWTKVQPTT